MEDTQPVSKRSNEEKGLSFSITRILQKNSNTMKRDVECRRSMDGDCSTPAQSCACIDQCSKFNNERPSDTMVPYAWQILSKQTSRRIGHPYQSRAAPKRKKPRTTFSRAQIAELEDLFTEKKYLTSSERQKVADYLSLSDCQVKTWFQNRRTKWKRETEEEKEEQRHAMTRTMMTLQKESLMPVQEFHHIACNAPRT